VLVFVFYQFRPPPLIFNETDAAQAAAARPAAYAQLEADIGVLHETRREAAMAFISSRSSSADPAAQARFVTANTRYLDKRREAMDFVRVTNDDSAFTDVNYVFPVFVIRHMPVGVVGLLIAAIMAAAMSSVAAELNSLATASTMDFYKRHFRQDGSEKELVAFGRLATLAWGVFACIVATFATNLGSLIEVVNTFGSFFYGSLLGVFVLAFALPRARATGAFYGLLFGMVSVWIASALTDIAFLWFNVVGCLATVAAGYAISLTGVGEK
jgi:Na+(H+)/acetate symporter ActP